MHTQTAVVTTIGVVTFLGIYLYQRIRKGRIPTKWQPVAKVKGLYMYPLKSGRRIELKTANCTEFGFKSGILRDRCLVVYKEEDMEHRTARTYPKMVLIEVTDIGSNQFRINAPGMDPLHIDVPILKSVEKCNEIVLWGKEKIFTGDCGDEAAQWFSQYLLGKPSGLRLGFHDGLPAHKRDIDKYHSEFVKNYPHLNSASGLYSDLASYLLLNQSSIDELKSRIPGSSLTAHNFRSNILVDGDTLKPFDEDSWEWLKIGEVVLQNVKPCARCTFTTIDPETGMRATDNEPLKTLKTYRKVKELTNIDLEGQDPIMGLYMGVRQTGKINIGDTVFIGKN